MVILIKLLISISVLVTVILAVMGWASIPSDDGWKSKLGDLTFYAVIYAMGICLIEVIWA